MVVATVLASAPRTAAGREGPEGIAAYAFAIAAASAYGPAVPETVFEREFEPGTAAEVGASDVEKAVAAGDTTTGPGTAGFGITEVVDVAAAGAFAQEIAVAFERSGQEIVAAAGKPDLETAVGALAEGIVAAGFVAEISKGIDGVVGASMVTASAADATEPAESDIHVAEAAGEAIAAVVGAIAGAFATSSAEMAVERFVVGDEDKAGDVAYVAEVVEETEDTTGRASSQAGSPEACHSHRA